MRDDQIRQYAAEIAEQAVVSAAKKTHVRVDSQDLTTADQEALRAELLRIAEGVARG